MNRFSSYAHALLSALILVPLAVVAVAGVILLRHEHDRLETTTGLAKQRWLGQVARELEQGLEQVRLTLEQELIQLAMGDIESGLEQIRDRNPLVRNTFWVNRNGERLLPPAGAHLDEEAERFLQRYDSLFAGRLPWFAAQPDDPYENLNRQVKGNSLQNWSNIRTQKVKSPSPVIRRHWKTWRWEESDELLLYVEHPLTREVVGLELERAALFSRLDVLLRELATTGEALVMRDRNDRVLIASEEPPDVPPDHSVDMGPLLGFARLEWHPRFPTSSGNPRGFYLASIGIGALLLLSILGGTLGLNAWLRRSRREALQKTTFVSNVSHEFKTPLTTLRLYSELLLEGRVADPEKQNRYLRTLRDESERLARLVHNVLDFSRLEMGRNRLQPVPISLLHHLQAVQERLAERLEARGLRVTLPDEEVHILCDPDGLDQILLNLFDNALKYAQGATDLRIGVREGSGNVRIEFRDNGPGIPPPHRKRIFHAFHQVDDSLTRESGGSGLGLHISRRIARQMNGDLTLLSSSSGACFLLTFPKVTS